MIGGGKMPISYTKLHELMKSKNMSLYKIKGIIGNATFEKIRKNAGEDISTKTICILCDYLECQPEDLISYIPGGESKSKVHKTK